MRKVAIVMGSKSDLPVAEKAVGVLRDYGVQMEVRVLSAHRCPNEAREFAASALEGGFTDKAPEPLRPRAARRPVPASAPRPAFGRAPRRRLP